MNYEHETPRCMYSECNNLATTYIEGNESFIPTCAKHNEKLPKHLEGAFRIYWEK